MRGCRGHAVDARIAAPILEGNRSASLMSREALVRAVEQPAADCLPCYLLLATQYCGAAGASFFSSGMSVTRASVVRIMPAIDTAFSTADRVTFAGSAIWAWN